MGTGPVHQPAVRRAAEPEGCVTGGGMNHGGDGGRNGPDPEQLGQGGAKRRNGGDLGDLVAVPTAAQDVRGGKS